MSPYSDIYLGVTGESWYCKRCEKFHCGVDFCLCGSCNKMHYPTCDAKGKMVRRIKRLLGLTYIGGGECWTCIWNNLKKYENCEHPKQNSNAIEKCNWDGCKYFKKRDWGAKATLQKQVYLLIERGLRNDRAAF